MSAAAKRIATNRSIPFVACYVPLGMLCAFPNKYLPIELPDARFGLSVVGMAFANDRGKQRHEGAAIAYRHRRVLSDTTYRGG